MTYRVWIDQSLDLLDASLEMFRIGKWMQSCVLSQQSIELNNKALILKAGIPFERTHDLSHLNSMIEKAGLHEFSAVEKRAAQVMTRTYLQSRYPIEGSETAPYLLFSEVDAKEHIGWALDNLDMLMHVDADFCSGDIRDAIQAKLNDILSNSYPKG